MTHSTNMRRSSQLHVLLYSLVLLFFCCCIPPALAQAEADLLSMLMGGGGDGGGGEGGVGKNGECPTHCKKDHLLPVPKARIRPYSNGCSVPEAFREGLGDYSHFEVCCDLHDACYQACGIDKNVCEKDFHKCLSKQCKLKKKGDEECASMAQLFTMGTSLFGCPGYVGLQEEVCECVPPPTAYDRVQEYANQFYAAYNGTHSLPESFVKKYLGTKPKSTSATQRKKLYQQYGIMVYQLWRKYPMAIDLIANRDGKSSREHDVFFDVNKQGSQDEL